MRHRYRLDIAERIRTEKGMDPEAFSAALNMTHNTYPIALQRGWLTRRQMREISLRFKVAVKEFVLLDGAT